MKEQLTNLVFKTVHRTNLVYNTCWEDPRIDRQVLDLSSENDLLVITSAGCNALDYLLAGAGSVTCVDMNPIQNALVELKAAAVIELEHHAFFEMFGRGRLADNEKVYRRRLRRHLSERSQKYWDRHIGFFADREGFYFRGTAGYFARLIGRYVDRQPQLRQLISELTAESCSVRREELYQESIAPRLWTPRLRWFLGRNTTLALLGVPGAQRRHLEQSYGGSIVSFIERVLREVFVVLPFYDNYFWKVYLDGRYSPQCCPEYLKAENFGRLKELVKTKLHVHTNSLVGFLRSTEADFDRFVLLDHLDWLKPAAITAEWEALILKSRPGTRYLWRSASPTPDFFHSHRLQGFSGHPEIADLIESRSESVRVLHQQDRVHTYGSLGLAELRRAA